MNMSRELIYRLGITFLFFTWLTPLNFAQTFTEEISAIADVIVDINGTGDYSTIQEGINAIPDENDAWKIIFVKKGIYHEKVILGYKKTKVILVGEDVDSTIVTNDDYGDKMLVDGDPSIGGHTFSTYTFRADAHDFQAYNFSFENPTTLGQGVAFHSNGDRQILYHCRLLGNQDTYFDNFRTRKYFKDCFIEGTTDYIFGFGVTLFDSCQIHSKEPSYITAASTPQYYEFGQVFKHCRLTSKPGLSELSLGRPWFDWANTIFYECWETEAIIPGGWSPWDGRQATCIYQEYNCFGPGADTLNRVDYGKQLPPSEAPRYVIDTIFAANIFPSDMGYTVDTNEFFHMLRRFGASGYTARADTIIYAGREEIYANSDSLPPYPTENWSPEFYSDVFDLVNEYTVPFMDSVNGVITIDNIYWNGNPVPDFDETTSQYVIELDDTVSMVPDITIEGSGVSASISYPESLPAEARINALSRDKVNGFEYSIYFSQDSAYWETEVKWIVINRADTLEMQPGIFEYDVVLPEGSTKITSLIVQTKVPGQTYQRQYPVSYPGTATVTVTAPDGVTTGTYNLNASLFVGVSDLIDDSDDLLVVNPVTDFLLINNQGVGIQQAEIKVFDLNGRMLLSDRGQILNRGMNNTGINISGFEKGIYLYSIKVDRKTYSGKFIIAN